MLGAGGDADSLIRAYDAGLTRGIAEASKKQRRDTGCAAGVKLGLGNLFVVVTDGNGQSFLTEAERDAAHASILPDKHERHLVAHMTPIFLERLMSSLPNDYVLVNSEEYPWIPPSSDLKINYTAPDHFVSPHYLVRFRPPYNNAPNNGEYGTFPVFTARRSLVAIGHATKKLDNKGEGEFMQFLEAISFSSTPHEIIVARGFVYDWETCSLMTAINGNITQITTVKWVTPGSYALVRNYFRHYEKEWHECLQMACTAMGVSVPRYSTINGTCGQCVLGVGDSGRVFLVQRGEQHLALKLVLGEDCCNELASEFELIGGLPAEVQTSVVGVVADSLWTGSLPRQNQDPLPAAAFLMSTIGIPFLHPSEVTDEYGPLILESLSDLHASNICHSDARYKNVVRLEDAGPPKRVEFRWIDLRTCGRASAFKFVSDLTTFFQSIDRPFNRDAVAQYAETTARGTWASTQERRLSARQLWN